MTDDVQDFKQFLAQRQQASDAYVNGDAGPLIHMTTQHLPATFFSPGGDSVQGVDEVIASYQSGATQFATTRDNQFETLQLGAADGIAYWVGLQRSTSQLKGKPEAVPMNLRVTEVFRRENGEWKMVHRHADRLKADEKK